MHILFELEDNLSIDIEKRDGKTILVFDNDDSRNSVINTYLNYWYDKKQVFSLDKYADDKDPRVKEYRSWRGRFKSNEASFEDGIGQSIAENCQPLLVYLIQDFITPTVSQFSKTSSCINATNSSE